MVGRSPLGTLCSGVTGAKTAWSGNIGSSTGNEVLMHVLLMVGIQLVKGGTGRKSEGTATSMNSSHNSRTLQGSSMSSRAKDFIVAKRTAVLLWLKRWYVK